MGFTGIRALPSVHTCSNFFSFFHDTQRVHARYHREKKEKKMGLFQKIGENWSKHYVFFEARTKQQRGKCGQ